MQKGTDRQIYRQAVTDGSIQIDVYRYTSILIDKQTDRKIDKYSFTNRQTDRH